MDSNSTKVKTDEMRQIATEIENKIKESKEAFEELEKIIKDAANYWEGLGADTHLEVYRKKMEESGNSIQAFFASANNLRTVAGIYEETEKQNIVEVEDLPTDVID